ncbi:unnamed protein product [Caenorhabditis auriculariae]|uniref:Uncharacterized protein n=1 Tax=Caenorhabditis auriculariae TaxID=2777116 RepID=A0A8S1H675_9PELO|nr:unnamed protein product [Caenorhabditis auriculariae]
MPTSSRKTRTTEESDESVPPVVRMTSVTDLAFEKMGVLEWETRWESILSALAFVMSTGNIWFFPVICALYGGYFPLQYTACFVLLAMPLLYLEMALGQYASASPLSVFSRMVPAMAGLSAAMTFLLIFRCVCLSVWTVFEFVLSLYAIEASWKGMQWKHCSLKDPYCFDYHSNSFLLLIRYMDECLGVAPNSSAVCDQVQQAAINTRGMYIKRPPFMNFVTNLMVKRSLVTKDWQPPETTFIMCAIVVWLIVAFLAMGGSKILGKSGLVAFVVLASSYVLLFVTSLTLSDAMDGFLAFFSFAKIKTADELHDVSAWADAAAHALRSLNVACGGMQKMASLNKFKQKFHRDVLLISLVSYFLHILIAITSYCVLAHLSSYFYLSGSLIYKVHLLAMPLTVQGAFPEIFTTWNFGWIAILLFFSAGFIAGVQGMATYIWVVASMIVERINGGSRMYGKPLTTWSRRALIIAGLVLGGLLSSLPFLTTGGVYMMIMMEQYASYGTILVALLEVITIAHLYGFRRFSVNIRAMIGGSGPLNIFWWVNWVIITPVSLFALFVCVIMTFGHNAPDFLGYPLEIEIFGWVVLSLATLWVIIYFILKDVDRRRNNEPFGTMFRATGDWGPVDPKRRLEATSLERALRVRY